MVNTEKLFQRLSPIYPVSTEFRMAIETELTQLTAPANYQLLQYRGISDVAYFLSDGLAISYTRSNKKKQVEWLWKSDQIIVSPRSFFERVASLEIIEIVIKSELLCIDYAGIMRLFDSFPEAHLVYRFIMNNQLEICRERIRDMHHLSAIARHRKLLASFKGIEQFLPQTHIASYLGITPQSLSRIKKMNRPTTV